VRRLSLANSPYHHYIEEDENFRRWVEALERGSILTASVYFRKACYSCEQAGITPQEVAKMDPKQAKFFLHDLISHFEKKGVKGSGIEGCVKAVKSWMVWNDIDPPKSIRIYGASDYNKYENEVPPTRQELRRILDVAGMRTKVSISLMAFCGFRPEVQGTLVGDDGLRLSDLPDLKIEQEFDGAGNPTGGTVSFANVPATVVCRKSISKAGHLYFVFLPTEGCQYLKNYLEWRMKPRAHTRKTYSHGRERVGVLEDVRVPAERLTPESPLIAAIKNRKSSHITTTNVCYDVKQAIVAAGFGWRPYVLRRYFEVCMMNAEYERLILREWREFWMGHVGNIESEYSVNKGLPHEAAEKMRQAYSQAAEKHLATLVQPTISKTEVVNTARVEALKMFGYSDEELAGLGDPTKITMERLQELIHQKSKQMLGLKEGTQKVVSVGELEGWIEQGWDYKRDLPNGKAVIGLRME
jgi:hypothetical protein